MRKSPMFRNETLMFHYRLKLQQNVSHLTGSQLPKMAFILSRSQVPFEEILFRDIFVPREKESTQEADLGAEVEGPQYTRQRISLTYRPMSFQEIGSLVPSLARAKYQAYEVIHPMCRDYIIQLSRDSGLNLAQPKYIKLFLERLLSLEYHKLAGRTDQKEHQSAGLFFSQTKQVI